MDKHIIDVDSLSNESDELLSKELHLFVFKNIQKNLLKELYKRTDKTTTFREDSLELILTTTKWRYAIYDDLDCGGLTSWTDYPVKLPGILQQLFYDHIYTIRLYEYRARIEDLEKRLQQAKLNIDKRPNAQILMVLLLGNAVYSGLERQLPWKLIHHPVVFGDICNIFYWGINGLKIKEVQNES